MKTAKRMRKKSTHSQTKKQFLYNPDDPKKSFDVYIDKNPEDTIKIKYTTLNDVKNTINKYLNLSINLFSFNKLAKNKRRCLWIIQKNINYIYIVLNLPFVRKCRKII
jgi:hypothetical protein